MGAVRLLADENIQAALVAALRSDGIDTAYVAEGTGGISDSGVLKASVEEQRILLTEDKDFGELVFRLKHKTPGIILMRFSGFDSTERHVRLRSLFDRYDDQLYGRYVRPMA